MVTAACYEKDKISQKKINSHTKPMKQNKTDNMFRLIDPSSGIYRENIK